MAESIKIPLIGVSDTARSPDVNSHDAINLMPQARNTGSKEQFYWTYTPGSSTFTNTLNDTINGTLLGITEWNGSLYAVTATKLYSVASDGQATELATLGVAITGRPAHFGSSGDYLAFVGEGVGIVYVWAPNLISGAALIQVDASAEQNPITQIVQTAGTTYTATFQNTFGSNLPVGDYFLVTGTTNFNNVYKVTGVSGLTRTFVHSNATDGPETGLTTAYGYYPKAAGPGVGLHFTPGDLTVMDTYFVSCWDDGKTGPEKFYFYVSYPDEPIVWLPLNFGAAQRDADPLIGVQSFRGDIWMFGTKTIETFYNSGIGEQPFAPSRPVVTNVGCVDQNTIANDGTALYWVGNEPNGKPKVFMSVGYDAKAISNRALELQLALFEQNTTESSAYGAYASYCYAEENCQFYVLSFGGSTFGYQTWVFDVTTSAQTGIPCWHKRQDTSGSRERGKYGASAYGKMFVTDHTEAEVHELSRVYSTQTVGGVETDFTRTGVSGATHANDMGMVHHSVMIDMDHPSTADTINLQWSDDGGTTFNTGVTQAINSTRIEFFGLGFARNQRVYKISMTTDQPVNILAAYLRATPCAW